MELDGVSKGKIHPDSFTRTVPFWCAVVNTAMAKGTLFKLLCHLSVAMIIYGQLVKRRSSTKLNFRLGS